VPYSGVSIEDAALERPIIRVPVLGTLRKTTLISGGLSALGKSLGRLLMDDGRLTSSVQERLDADRDSRKYSELLVSNSQFPGFSETGILSITLIKSLVLFVNHYRHVVKRANFPCRLLVHEETLLLTTQLLGLQKT
jgi:hypothetical protein